MKILFLLPYLIYLSNVTEVKWNESTPLTWSNFSADIDSESEYDAWTFSGFNYTYTWKRMDGAISVECSAFGYFDPTLSWVKKNKQSDELLKHEQLHFDISELYSRYFEQRMKAFRFSNDVASEVDSIYTVTFDELLNTQIKYDEETNHYHNKTEQNRWEKFVKMELEKLKEFE